MSAEFLKMAPSTKRFFEGAPFEAPPNDLPALFGLRVEYDRWMPDGFVAIVGEDLPFNPDHPLDMGRQTRFFDLRPKGN